MTVNHQAKAGGSAHTADYHHRLEHGDRVNDVAQVVDGNWMTAAAGAAGLPGDTGFDRLIAIGDISYEITP